MRKVRRADVPTLVEVLARAFDDDPWVNWLARQDGGRAGAIRRLFRVCLEDLALRHDECWTSDALAGAALWIPPGQWKVGVWDQVRMIPDAVRVSGVGRVLSIGKGTATIAKAHPKERHWYLLQLGVDPPAQGKGIGRALMAPILERCDRDRIGAYLETARESNLGFYQRDGFAVTSEHRIPDGPTVWSMWRAPE